jgi:tetratricopeptide (TPR) repeat protein
MPVIQIIIGVILGIAICFYLIRPTLQKTGTDTGQISDVNEQLSVQSTQISALETERDSLNEEIEDLNKQLEDGDTEAKKQLASYEKLLEGIGYYLSNDKIQAAVAVADCKKTDFSTSSAKKLYTTIGNISETEIASLVSQGRNEMYQSYDGAIAIFEQVLALDDENQEAMTYMARCYQRKGKNKTAKKWYKKAIQVNDTTAVAAQAESWLAEITGDSGDNPTGE